MYATDIPTALPPRKIWEITRSQLQLQMTKSTFDTWVRDSVCIAQEDNTFVIAVPNAYAKDWLSMRLRPMIRRTLTSVVGRTVEVDFVVQPSAIAEPSSGSGLVPLLDTSAEEQPAPTETPMPIAEGIGLNPRHTFENFIVGPSNRMAHAVALAVAERPGRAYNPLFLYGGVGLGKTHLLQAIGAAARSVGQRVLYVSSELFTNDLITAIRTQSTEQFRGKYRTIDILLIDDVQFIAGKEQTQEEFFHTFNTLHSANRQIVMTSDRPPQAIPTLEERLRSRFGWGMIADIQPPSLETRVAILQSKAASLREVVPDDVLLVIAQRAHRNIRDLEGALTRVLAHARLLKRPLNVPVVDEALAYLAPTQSKLSLEAILEVAARHFGISQAELVGRGRTARIAGQRQMVMYVMREETGASLPQIGAVLGGRDHTTVMHGCERIATQLESDSDMRQQVNDLRERLYQHQPR